MQAAAVQLAKAEARKRKLELQVLDIEQELSLARAEYDQARDRFDAFFPEIKRLMVSAQHHQIADAAVRLSHDQQIASDWSPVYSPWACDSCGGSTPLYRSTLYLDAELCADCVRKDAADHSRLADLVRAVLDENPDDEWILLGPNTEDFKCGACGGQPTRWLCCSDVFRCEACFNKNSLL
jgi:hypothetical protein